jgi:hypothetical protein
MFDMDPRSRTAPQWHPHDHQSALTFTYVAKIRNMSLVRNNSGA